MVVELPSFTLCRHPPLSWPQIHFLHLSSSFLHSVFPPLLICLNLSMERPPPSLTTSLSHYSTSLSPPCPLHYTPPPPPPPCCFSAAACLLATTAHPIELSECFYKHTQEDTLLFMHTHRHTFTRILTHPHSYMHRV